MGNAEYWLLKADPFNSVNEDFHFKHQGAILSLGFMNVHNDFERDLEKHMTAFFNWLDWDLGMAYVLRRKDLLKVIENNEEIFKDLNVSDLTDEFYAVAWIDWS